MIKAPGTVARRLKNFVVALTAAILVSVFATACEEDLISTEEYLQRASEYRAKGDFRASNIEARNALRIDPNNQDARYLTGANYLDLGAWPFAEVTLERAMKDKGTLEYAILPPLTRAKLALRKFDEAFDLAQVRPNMNADLTAEILMLRGQALVGRKKPELARKAFEASLKANSKSYEAYLGLAGLAVKEREDAKAENLLAKALEIAPDAIETLHFQGQYNAFKKNNEIAEQAFTAVVKKRPTRIDFQLDLIETIIAQGKFKEAIASLDPIVKRAPKFPRANYLRALAAYRTKDYTAAATYSSNVLSVATKHGASTLILGVASYANGQNEQAVRALEQYLVVDPENTVARKILGAAQFRLNRAKAAVTTLEPIAQHQPDDEALLWMIGKAAGQSGDLKKSSSYFQKVVELRPEDSRARATLGATMIAMGDSRTGIDELERAVGSNPDIPQADITLVVTLLRTKRYDEALTAAKRLQKNHPDQPYGYTAAGAAYMAKSNLPMAKAAFEKALAIRPGIPDAATNLAQIDMQDGNPRKARALLLQVVELNPRHFRTLVILGELDIALKNPAKAMIWLERAVEINRAALQPNLLMARLLLQGGSHEKALLIAEGIANRYANNAGLLEVIGKAQMAAGRSHRAREAFETLVKVRPQSAEAKYLLSNASLAMARWEDAQQELESALALDPKHSSAKISLADLFLRQNRLDAAGKVIGDLANDTKDDPRTLVLLGRLAQAKGRMQDAIDWFMKARGVTQTDNVTLLLARAQVEAGKIAAAKENMQGWLKEHPRDANVRFQLASLHTILNETEEAKEHFLKLVEQHPRNWLFLNNLASVLNILDENTLALDYAERAYKVMGNQPAVMDTYGMILLKNGKTEKAIQMLQRARERVPDSMEIAFNLARALAQNNQKDEARMVLQKMLSGGEKFRMRKSAEVLLENLGG